MMEETGDILDLLRCQDDGVTSESCIRQKETEEICIPFLKRQSMPQFCRLSKEKIVGYLRRGLESPLGPSYSSLDAGRPWLIYWMLHALVLVDEFPDDLVNNIRSAIKVCMAENGEGFGGGFMQVSHTATTYASVLTLCELGDVDSLAVIDRSALYRFFMGLKDKNTGAFMVHRGGETDTRGIYTVLSVCSILGIITPELTKGCADFLSRCQTFEGGIAGEPGGEAHGGYSFCAFASLCILDRLDVIDLDAFVHWVAYKQMRLEGGFQGRTNKLVDSCYSFWQGAIPALLKKYAGISAKCECASQGSLIYDQTKLQKYVLLCCQFEMGGMIDKPGQSRDQYHTCYALSGLSVSQENGGVVWGNPENRLVETDPVYNIACHRLERAKEYFKKPFVPPITDC